MKYDAIEALLCERYNVSALDGPLKDALDGARAGGSTAPLRALLAERELYRWQVPIMAALGEEPVTVGATEEAPPEPEAPVAVQPEAATGNTAPEPAPEPVPQPEPEAPVAEKPAGRGRGKN